MTLVESLKIMKKVSGMTTKDVADKSGVPEPTLEKIFSGATTDPKVSTMRSIVNAMGFNLDDLYKEDLDKNKKPLVSHDEELLNELWYYDRNCFQRYDFDEGNRSLFAHSHLQPLYSLQFPSDGHDRASAPFVGIRREILNERDDRLRNFLCAMVTLYNFSFPPPHLQKEVCQQTRCGMEG